MISPYWTTKILGLIHSIFHHLVDICQVHTVLQYDDRDVRKQSSQNAKCDKHLKTGWYRFLNIPGIAMATECPQCAGTCGTTYSGWFNGDYPTVDEGEVERTVCFGKDSSRCCQEKNFIKVKNCSSFYVYRLVPTAKCPYRYCFTYNDTS